MPGAEAEDRRAAERETLFQALREARTETEGRQIEAAIWRFWTTAPDAAAQTLLDRAFTLRQRGELHSATEAAEALTAAYPDFPEGWNQLATLQFLQNRHEASLVTIERVLALEPKHFGALIGRALIMFRQGRVALSQRFLRDAVEIHPWLEERHLLPQPAGSDL